MSTEQSVAYKYQGYSYLPAPKRHVFIKETAKMIEVQAEGASWTYRSMKDKHNNFDSWEAAVDHMEKQCVAKIAALEAEVKIQRERLGELRKMTKPEGW